MSAEHLITRILTMACKNAGRASKTNWGHHWMKCLAKGFQSEYPASDLICHAPGERKSVIIGSVRKSEMLFDILVAGWEANAIPSTNKTTRYPRLKPPIWAVESEVDTGAAQVLFDFNKLLLANVPNKLLVTKNRRSNSQFTRLPRDAGIGHNHGDIYVAYVPAFDESTKKGKHASPEWRIANGDVRFAIYVIRDGKPVKLVDPFT
jgi:hypothetical protein